VIKNKIRLNIFFSKGNEEKMELNNKIEFLVKNNNLCFYFIFEFFKKLGNLLRKYKFVVFLFICIYIETFIFFFEGKIIIVKNAEKDEKTFARIILQNKIDFIPKISVIISTYNSGELLINCLETVINQTLKQIEIICVDDGSTDNTLDILKKFAKKDERITILKQKHFNSGVARNAGLTIAKGKYLSFLDSDNFFNIDMLKEMYEKIVKEKSDIIICQSKSKDLKTGIINEKSFGNSYLIPNKNSFSVKEISKHIFQIFEAGTGDKLFRTNFIAFHNLKFQNIINFNDNQFTYTALCKAKSITTLKKNFVIKRYENKNLLSANKKKDAFCLLLSFDKIKYNLEKSGLYNLVKESFWNWVIKLFI